MKNKILKVGNVVIDWDKSIYKIEKINEDRVCEIITLKQGSFSQGTTHMDWYIKDHCKLLGTSSKIIKVLYG